MRVTKDQRLNKEVMGLCYIIRITVIIELAWDHLIEIGCEPHLQLNIV